MKDKLIGGLIGIFLASLIASATWGACKAYSNEIRITILETTLEIELSNFRNALNDLTQAVKHSITK